MGRSSSLKAWASNQDLRSSVYAGTSFEVETGILTHNLKTKTERLSHAESP